MKSSPSPVHKIYRNEQSFHCNGDLKKIIQKFRKKTQIDTNDTIFCTWLSEITIWCLEAQSKFWLPQTGYAPLWHISTWVLSHLWWWHTIDETKQLSDELWWDTRPSERSFVRGWQLPVNRDPAMWSCLQYICSLHHLAADPNSGNVECPVQIPRTPELARSRKSEGGKTGFCINTTYEWTEWGLGSFPEHFRVCMGSLCVLVCLCVKTRLRLPLSLITSQPPRCGGAWGVLLCSLQRADMWINITS